MILIIFQLHQSRYSSLDEGMSANISIDNTSLGSVGDGDSKTEFPDYVASYQTIQDFIFPSFDMTHTSIHDLIKYIGSVLIVAQHQVIAQVQYYKHINFFFKIIAHSFGKFNSKLHIFVFLFK